MLPDHDLNLLTRRYNLTLVRVIDYSPNTYILEANDTSPLAGVAAANLLYEREGVEFATPLMGKYFEPRFVPNDSLYQSKQWHLKNTAQYNIPDLVAGNDVNIEGVWDSYKGNGINIAIVDSGVDYFHPDLAPNYRADIDTNLVGYPFAIDDAQPPCNFRHGSYCAGCAAAKGNNSEGIAGAAFNAAIVGVRLLSGGFVSDEDVADAMNHMVNPVQTGNRVHISSNSWGPQERAAGQFVPLEPLTQAAILNGVNNGRGGKGTIYLFAHGNGNCWGDYGNADAYTSSQYTIAVGATGGNGKKSPYSEKGAALLINAPSSSNADGNCSLTPQGNPTYTATHFITTVDLSCDHQIACLGGSCQYPLYYLGFTGTSAATPTAAGVIALVLQANPNLTWRDVQHLLVRTATKNDPTDAGWVVNGAGFNFNHKHGFGRINAGAAVNALATWNYLPTRATEVVASESTVVSIPDNNFAGIARSRTISGAANFRAEHVEVVVNVTHPKRSDLRFQLVSPNGTVATLHEPNTYVGANLNNYLFTSVVTWGENPNGNWQLKIADEIAGNAGTLNSWTLKVYGHARYSINCGGSTVSPFAADTYFSSGSAFVPSPTTVDVSGVANPAPMFVYQTARVRRNDEDSFAYTLRELKAGQNHLVRLHFAELYFTLQNEAVFDVYINGTRVLQNFDILNSSPIGAGAMFKAVVKEFTTQPNANKEIIIQVVPLPSPLTGQFNATLNGLQVIPQ